MDLNELLQAVADSGLTIENYFRAGNQRFVNLCLEGAEKFAVTVEVCGDMPEKIRAAKERIVEDMNRPAPTVRGKKAPMVMGDIQPYISMIDGSVIESRSKHRAHLKAHNCIEIGNETKYLYQNAKPLESPSGLKDHIIRAVNEAERKQRRSH
jgi:hypothetical protein